MKNAVKIAALAAIMTYASAAQAEMATYVTTGGEQTVTGTETMFGSMQVGTSVATYGDGSKRSESWTCIGASNPPNSKVFDVHFVCDLNSDAGSYAINFGCQNLPDGSQGCVGGLQGKSGIYKGKVGATTWAGTGGTGSGTIHWKD
ncbi:hypothetical protein P7228_00305 [Altererythrobacter arenosus]|uniref:Uncharacterized protein n=1 Tax=Altererythrobacter arenosus TaxID=3032592 RepID=A0ABY8FZW6_9SPHN|nr:hypothetical protein [Altererythrobacter sp. CAU 1644]WFL77539.1 hypothetical protein P7228_00305 [Altererythrobacter sp. CAU 1644]